MLSSPRLNPPASQLASFGGVMSGRARPYHMPGFEGPLSIKTMVRGEAKWRTPERNFVVEPDHVLILNEGQHYTLTVDSEREIETFCPFFAPALVREAIAARRHSLSRAMEIPDPNRARVPEFTEQLRRPSVALAGALQRFRIAILDGEGEIEDAFLALLDATLDVALIERSQIEGLSALRATTRVELYRRVARACDYMHANLAQPLPLETLAKVAALSRYHFHRVFRAQTGVTPAGYLRELRLLRAHRLLVEQAGSVTSVCFLVGFTSLGSFSSAFKRRFGYSPASVRMQVRR